MYTILCDLVAVFASDTLIRRAQFAADFLARAKPESTGEAKKEI